LYKFLYLLLLSVFLKADEYEYVLGEGYKINSLPLYIGGYFSSEYQYKTDDAQSTFKVDDIALIGYGSYNKFSYLAEFEFKEFYINEWGKSANHELNSNLHTERLYIDYTFNENYMLRVGKYNSPIGYWNLTPINVLRDTTSSPQTNSLLFPKYTTGLDLTYTSYSDYELKIDLLVQNNNDFDDMYNNLAVNKHYGLGLEFSENDLSLKLNGGYFHTKDNISDNENIYYSLASFKYDTNKFKLMGEVGTQFSKDETIVPYSGYLQGLYTITEKHLPVIRLESYKSNANTPLEKDDILTIGYTYRPIYSVAFKAEYQFHSISEENKTLVSFSVLF